MYDYLLLLDVKFSLYSFLFCFVLFFVAKGKIICSVAVKDMQKPAV